MALVLASGNNDHTSTSDDTAAHYEINRDQRGSRDYLALVPMSQSHESSGTTTLLPFSNSVLWVLYYHRLLLLDRAAPHIVGALQATRR